MDFIQMPNDFQLNKLIFFKHSKYSEATKRTYWNQYLLYVADLEMKYNKDLYFLNSEEIQEYINAIKEKSENTIKQTNSFIIKYMEWYSVYYKVEKKTFNLFIEKLKEDWYISKNNFFKMCNKMLEVEELALTCIIPLIYARYGILGKEANYMRGVKWQDIDYDKKTVLIYDFNRDNILSYIPVDEDFLNWMHILKQYEKALYKGQKVKNNYVIKSQIEKEEMVNYATLNTKSYRAFDSIKTKRIAFYTLVNCAIVDYLYSIYKNKQLQSNQEFFERISVFYPKEKFNITKLAGIKNLYIDVTENKNLMLHERKKVKDCDALENHLEKEDKDDELLYSKYAVRNAIVSDDNITYLIIKRGDIKNHIRIDSDIVGKIKKYEWYFNIDNLVVTRKRRKDKLEVMCLANFILDVNKYYKIEFKNDDKFDYRKENLIKL